MRKILADEPLFRHRPDWTHRGLRSQTVKRSKHRRREDPLHAPSRFNALIFKSPNGCRTLPACDMLNTRTAALSQMRTICTILIAASALSAQAPNPDRNPEPNPFAGQRD